MRAWGIALAGLTLAAPPAAQAVTTVSSCTYAKLTAAVAKGGEVRFACDGSIRFTKRIDVGGRNGTLDATGRTPSFDGRGRNQLFTVAKGGRLTLVNLILQNAKAGGVSGRNGTSGTAGTAGADGSNGTNGVNGVPSNPTGTPGLDATAGAPGTDGT